MVSGPGRWVGIPECTRPNVSEPTSTGIPGGRYRAVGLVSEAWTVYKVGVTVLLVSP